MTDHRGTEKQQQSAQNYEETVTETADTQTHPISQWRIAPAPPNEHLSPSWGCGSDLFPVAPGAQKESNC